MRLHEWMNVGISDWHLGIGRARLGPSQRRNSSGKNALVKAEGQVRGRKPRSRFLDRIESELRLGGRRCLRRRRNGLLRRGGISERANPIPKWVAELRQLKSSNEAEPGSRTLVGRPRPIGGSGGGIPE